MTFQSRFLSAATLVAALGMFALQTPIGAAENDTPKVSTFAPAEDLVRQADKYVETMKKTVDNKEEYDDSEGKLGRDANTLAVVALALGLHDQKKGNTYKGKAAAVIKAAQKIAATKDYDAAKKAVAEMDNLVAGDGKLKWEKVASLPDLMKQVPIINTKLKNCLSGTKFKKKAKDSAGYAAVIAAIAQGVINDTSATKNATQVKQWQKFSKAMRDDAGAVNAAIHKQDKAATDKAMAKLNQSCEDCHAVFKPDVPADGSKK